MAKIKLPGRCDGMLQLQISQDEDSLILVFSQLWPFSTLGCGKLRISFWYQITGLMSGRDILFWDSRMIMAQPGVDGDVPFALLLYMD